MTTAVGARSRTWKPLIRAAVSAAILVGVARKIDWSHVAESFASLRWQGWLAAVGVYVAAQVLSSVRWQWLSQPLGFHRPLRAYVADYFVGMFFNLLLPTSIGGDAVRAIALNAGSGRKMPALVSVLLDRLSGLLMLLALACGAAAFTSATLPGWMLLTIGTCAAAGVLGLASLPVVIRLLSRLEGQRSSAARLRRFAELLRASLAHFSCRPGLVIAAAALSLAIQISGVVQVALIGWALGLDVPATVYGVAAPMVALLTLAPVSVSGMGVREAGMVVFLQPAGVDAGRAATLAFLWFCSQLAAGLAGGAVYLLRWSRGGEVRDDDALGDHPDQGRTRQHRPAA